MSKQEAMKGQIDQWNDDKGFGFIRPDNGSERIFFHISSVKTNSRRPKIGDIVLFDSFHDTKHRLKAKSVVIEGATKTANQISKSKIDKIEPPKKSFLDYILMVVCVLSLIAAGSTFFQSRAVEKPLIYGIPAVVALIVLNRQKRPKEKSFSCAGCRKIADFDARTIEAWNRGFTRLYCKSSHLEWLKNNPNQDLSIKRNRSGCLGTFVLLGIVPTLGSIWLYKWLV